MGAWHGFVRTLTVRRVKPRQTPQGIPERMIGSSLIQIGRVAGAFCSSLGVQSLALGGTLRSKSVKYVPHSSSSSSGTCRRRRSAAMERSGGSESGHCGCIVVMDKWYASSAWQTPHGVWTPIFLDLSNFDQSPSRPPL